MEIYIVQQIVAVASPIDGYELEYPPITEFVGVFDSKSKAEAACRDFTYFVAGPIPLNESAPHETTPNWPRDIPPWFPIARTAEDRMLPGEHEATP
jgi:hypothetical protein